VCAPYHGGCQENPEYTEQQVRQHQRPTQAKPAGDTASRGRAD
jgi:hypothetical protein